jgi:hypothetical protein
MYKTYMAISSPSTPVPAGLRAWLVIAQERLRAERASRAGEEAAARGKTDMGELIRTLDELAKLREEYEAEHAELVAAR